MKKTTMSKLICSGMALAILGLSALSGTQAVKAEEPVSYDGNAYVYLDIDQEKLSYSTVVTCSDELYNGYYGIDREERTIIGFDSLDERPIASISRLTMTITYNTYKWWDSYRWFPSATTEDFTIEASEENTYIAQRMSLLGPQGYPAKDIYHALAIPSIGSVATDYMMLENAVLENNLADASEYTEIEPTFYDKEFYVIMPVERDIRRVWISIDAYTVGGDHISDGLDDDGTPFEDEFGDYIELSDTTAVGAHFTDFATVTMITVINVTGTGLTLKFGEFDYQDSTFVYLKKEVRFDDWGVDLNDISLAYGNDAILVLDEGSTATVKIYYVSDGPAVYSNIVGPDGPEPDDCTNGCNVCVTTEWYERTFAENIACLGRTAKIIISISIVVVILAVGLWLYIAFFLPIQTNRELRKVAKK